MQRRGGSGQPVKGQSTKRPKARKAPTARRIDHRSARTSCRSNTRVDEAREQLTEALEYQTATGEVLNVISRSPTDVQPVFDMIAESAARLCEAQFCFVYRFDGQLLHFVAHHSLTPEVLEINRRAYPAPPSRRSGRLARYSSEVSCRSLMSTRTPSTPSARWRRPAAIAAPWASRYCATVFPSVHCGRPRSGGTAPGPTDRTLKDLRRPGGDRDRERAAVRGSPGAHAR